MATDVGHDVEIANNESRDVSPSISSNSVSSIQCQNNEDSPWLSKPRRPEPKPRSSILNSTIVCTSTPVRNNTTLPIEIFDEARLISLKRFKLGLESEHVWKLIRDSFNISSDYDVVSLDDCLKVVKQFFKMDLDTKKEIYETISDGGADYVESKLKKLEKENIKLRERLQMFEEERMARCETEKELFKIRQIIQTLINDKRRMETLLIEQDSEKNCIYKDRETQTDVNISTEKEVKKLQHTCELFQISTQKLLEFTKNVHEILTNHKKITMLTNGSVKNIEKSDATMTRKPIMVKRAASVQNGSGDVTNYFVDKYGNGGRVCRAASVCTVANRQNLNKCTNGVQNDILERMALKAKEITDTIEAVLNEDTATMLPRQVHWV